MEKQLKDVNKSLTSIREYLEKERKYFTTLLNEIEDKLIEIKEITGAKRPEGGISDR